MTPGRKFSNLNTTAKQFRRKQSGSIAMMTALILPPLILILMIGIDFLRYASIRSELSGALDSGLLVAAALDVANTGDADVDHANVEQIMRDFLRQNADPKLIDLDEVTFDVEVTQDESGREVEIFANYTVSTVFLHVINVDKFDVQVNSAGRQAFQTVEISMVLDISSSMAGTRLNLLRPAAKEFIETMLRDEESRDLTSISLIPFGGTVNMGDTFRSYVDENTIDIIAEGNEGKPAPLGTTDDLHFGDGHQWLGCFEFGVNDFNEDDFQSSLNDNLPSFWKWRINNPWCPKKESEAIFVSNNEDALKARIDEMALSDGTGMDIGVAVGLKALSPKLQDVLSNDVFPDRPFDFESEALKVLVIMTDGEITRQSRPEADHPLKGNYAGGQTIGCNESNDRGLGRNSEFRNNNNLKCDVNPSGRPASGKFYNTSVQNFKKLCDAAKANNVIIYTIGFQIRQDRDSHQLLTDCPQTPSNYIFVEDTDIAAAFSSIAASITGLRIVK